MGRPAGRSGRNPWTFEAAVSTEAGAKTIKNYRTFLTTALEMVSRRKALDRRCNLFTTNYDACFPLVADELVKEGRTDFVLNDGARGFIKRILIYKLVLLLRRPGSTTAVVRRRARDPLTAAASPNIGAAHNHSPWQYGSFREIGGTRYYGDSRADTSREVRAKRRLEMSAVGYSAHHTC